MSQGRRLANVGTDGEGHYLEAPTSSCFRTGASQGVDAQTKRETGTTDGITIPGRTPEIGDKETRIGGKSGQGSPGKDKQCKT